MTLYQTHVKILRAIRFRLARKHALVCAQIRVRRIYLRSAKDLIPIRQSLATRLAILESQIDSAKQGNIPALF